MSADLGRQTAAPASLQRERTSGRVAGHRDEGGGAPTRPQTPQQRRPVAVRHEDVRDDEVGTPIRMHRKRFGSAVGRKDGVSDRRQGVTRALRVGAVVVHDEGRQHENFRVGDGAENQAPYVVLMVNSQLRLGSNQFRVGPTHCVSVELSFASG